MKDAQDQRSDEPEHTQLREEKKPPEMLGRLEEVVVRERGLGTEAADAMVVILKQLGIEHSTAKGGSIFKELTTPVDLEIGVE